VIDNKGLFMNHKRCKSDGGYLLETVILMRLSITVFINVIAVLHSSLLHFHLRNPSLNPSP
jgi:hypothetical protein